MSRVRVYFLVEGFSEENLVNRMLGPHLAPFGLDCAHPDGWRHLYLARPGIGRHAGNVYEPYLEFLQFVPIGIDAGVA